MILMSKNIKRDYELFLKTQCSTSHLTEVLTKIKDVLTPKMLLFAEEDEFEKAAKIKKDIVSVLKFNTYPNSVNSLGRDYPFEIAGIATEVDGYASSRTVKITFMDSNDDGIVDDPEAFNMILLCCWWSPPAP